MERLTAFVSEHIGDDTTRLIMNKAKWPEIDMDLAVNCIESRRKLKGKVQEWCDEPSLIFPRKLSAEQCSSSITGEYKAEVAEKISRLASLARNDSLKIADLTGGLGVDSWFFSKKAVQVMYCEMLPELCNAARHNFSVLGAENISVRNVAVATGAGISPLASLGRNDKTSKDGRNDKTSKDGPNDNVMSNEDEVRDETSVFKTPTQILSDFQPDIVYMDPARRGENGKKVFLIEDCTPDVLTLKDEIFQHTRHILLKLSPMADITMVCNRLGRCCREVHVVAAGGECKELLIWMDRDWDDEYMIHAVELHKDGETGVFSFTTSQEKVANGHWSSSHSFKAPSPKDDKASCQMLNEQLYLFEPGKALMKAGAFNLISERFQIHKLGQSTHYYVFSATLAEDSRNTDITGEPYTAEQSLSSKCSSHDNNVVETLKQHGKVFRIVRMEPLDKRTIKAAGKEFPKAEVTARNIPMDTESLRKKLGVTSGDDAHIFGLKSDSAGALLIITK